MANSISDLLPEDEHFHHQFTDTFAAVSSSDHAWTEKVCAMAMARDGSLQIGFGLGKYANRDVIDSYGAVSRGVEQVTVRASRRLSDAPSDTVVGPLHYEIIEPMKKVRFLLEPNEVQPIAFDWTFECVVPPFVEERTHLRRGYRLMSDLVRYHQTGVAQGWIEVDGVRTPMTPDSWVSTRDHSWGVRYGVGVPVADVEPVGDGIPPGMGFMMIWCPVLMEKADGTQYAMHLHFTWIKGHGYEEKMTTARIEYADGSSEVIANIEPELRFQPNNRRLLGGALHCTMADGSRRTLTIEVMADTGVQLGAGLYFGMDGHYHGEWRGPMHVDGERIADCSTPEQARRLHQIRDTVIAVTDSSNGARGWGNCQPTAYGPWPDLGLADDAWM